MTETQQGAGTAEKTTGPTLPPISLGRIVHYKLTAADCKMIEEQRTQVGKAFSIGGTRPGMHFPAIVVSDHQTLRVSLQVFLNGNDQLYCHDVGHRNLGDWAEGTFAWPTYTYPKQTGLMSGGVSGE